MKSLRDAERMRLKSKDEVGRMKDETEDETRRQRKKKIPVSPCPRFSASFVLNDAPASDLDRKDPRCSSESTSK